MRLSLLVLAASSLVLGNAQDIFLAHEPAHEFTPMWTPTYRMLDTATEAVELRFFLKDYAGARLEEELMRVSDPKSRDYSQHLSIKELKQLLACRPETVVNHVHAATQTNAESLPVHISLTGDFVSVVVTVNQASNIFGGRLRFGEYSAQVNVAKDKEAHSVSVRRMIGVHPEDESLLLSGMALPDHVAQEVDASFGFGVMLSSPQLPRKKPLAASMSSQYPANVPKDLYRHYNYTPDEKWVNPKGANVIYMEGSGMKNQHVATYFSDYAPELKGQVPKLEYGKIVGTDDGEGAMDLEMIMTFGRYIPTHYYDFDNVNTDRQSYEAMSQFAGKLVDAQSTFKPWSVSSSWGPSKIIPGPQNATDRAFMKAGVVGVSIMFANGDDSCDINNKCSSYHTDKPVGPHVTLVGGVACNSKTFEYTTWPGTSGGFSQIWKLPSWQKDAVEHYFSVQKDLPSSKLYDRTKRGDPDIAACAQNVVSVDVYGKDPGGGTSFASPMVAGLVSTLNQHRAMAGKNPLGFLNPLLYHLSTTCADCFTDIVTGSNAMEACPRKCSTRDCEGWKATQGWDPATGLGMPNFNNMLAAVMKLP